MKWWCNEKILVIPTMSQQTVAIEELMKQAMDLTPESARCVFVMPTLRRKRLSPRARREMQAATKSTSKRARCLFGRPDEHSDYLGSEMQNPARRLNFEEPIEFPC
jgi:hypothetical protein